MGDNGGSSAGQADVSYGIGAATRDKIDLTNLTRAQGFIIQGDAAGDQAGYCVSSAGDVNNDGYADLIVGAPPYGGSSARKSYVIYGVSTATRNNIDLTNLNRAQGFMIAGDAEGDHVGYSVSSAGDVNNDGYDYLIVGAPNGDNGGDAAGQAYVNYGDGTATRDNIELTNLTPAQGFIIAGDQASDLAGYSVSSAGDVNNDGYDDLIVEAPFGDNGDNGDNGGNSAGEAYGIYGGATATRKNIDLTNLTQAQGFIIQGDAAGAPATRIPCRSERVVGRSGGTTRKIDSGLEPGLLTDYRRGKREGAIGPFSDGAHDGQLQPAAVAAVRATLEAAGESFQRCGCNRRTLVRNFQYPLCRQADLHGLPG